MRTRRAGALAPAPPRRIGLLPSSPLVLAAYSLLALAMTWPLAVRLATSVPNDLGDPLGLTWVLWWNAQALPLTARWLNAPIFFPSPGAIVLQDSLLGVWPVTTALQRAGLSPLATHNLLLIASFALSGFTAYLLCVRLVAHRGAAFCGGLVFGFALYRWAQVSHVNVLLTFWLPLVLLGLHAYADTHRWRWLALAGACWALQGLTSGYFLVYTAVLVALWALFFLRRAGDCARLALTFGGAFAAIWPWTSIYRSVHAHYGFARQAGEAAAWAADAGSLLKASPLLAVWGRALGDATREDQLFPGLTLVVLCLVAVLGSRFWTAPWLSRGSRWCLGAAAAFGTLAGVAAVAATSFTVLGVRVSLGRVDRPLAWTWLFLLAALALAPPVRRAWRDRSIPGFYTLAALACWLLSLGPEARLMGERVWYKSPYSWLLLLPGFDAVRVPARFWMLALVALAIVAAHGLARLARRAPAAGRAVIGLACVGLLAETWPAALPLLPPPGREPALEARLGGAPVLELPLGAHEDDLAAMYRATSRSAPLVNGYSGFMPASFVALRVGLTRGDPEALVPLAELTPLDVLVHTAAGPPDAAWTAQAAAVESLGAQLVASTGQVRLYHLPKRAPLVEPPPGTPLAVTRVTARKRDVTPAMTSASASRWVFTDGLEVTLGRRSQVGEVQLVMAPGPAGVTVSGLDGNGAWQELWSGPIAERMVRAALADPGHPRLRLRFGARDVDRLRVAIHMPHDGDVIGVQDLRVFP